jgi:hypothetical protein
MRRSLAARVWVSLASQKFSSEIPQLGTQKLEQVLIIPDWRDLNRKSTIVELFAGLLKSLQ